MSLLARCFLLPGSTLQASEARPGSLNSLSLLEPESGDDFLRGLLALREAALSSSRGGKSAAVSIQDLDASVDGNLLSGTVTTGSVHIGENTSTALDEISCVVVNSGNHVSIQGSTISSVVIDA